MRKDDEGKKELLDERSGDDDDMDHMSEIPFRGRITPLSSVKLQA